MRYQRTQIYLDPERHRALVKEAGQRGISLAALLREVVEEHVRERAPRYGEKSFDAIIGIVSDAGPSDVAGRVDELVGKAFEEEYERETAWLRGDAAAPRRRKRKRE